MSRLKWPLLIKNEHFSPYIPKKNQEQNYYIFKTVKNFHGFQKPWKNFTVTGSARARAWEPHTKMGILAHTSSKKCLIWVNFWDFFCGTADFGQKRSQLQNGVSRPVWGAKICKGGCKKAFSRLIKRPRSPKYHWPNFRPPKCSKFALRKLFSRFRVVHFLGAPAGARARGSHIPKWAF